MVHMTGDYKSSDTKRQHNIENIKVADVHERLTGAILPASRGTLIFETRDLRSLLRCCRGVHLAYSFSHPLLFDLSFGSSARAFLDAHRLDCKPEDRAANWAQQSQRSLVVITQPCASTLAFHNISPTLHHCTRNATRPHDPRVR